MSTRHDDRSFPVPTMQVLDQFNVVVHLIKHYEHCKLTVITIHKNCNVYSHFHNNHIEFIKTLTKLYILFSLAAGKHSCAIYAIRNTSVLRMYNSLFGFPNCLTNNMAQGYIHILTGTAFTLTVTTP